MNILMLSWEYPPISYGGLARHVQDLSEALAQKGHRVTVITQGDGKLAQQETIKGVKIYRTYPVQISANNFVDEILHLNFQILERTFRVLSAEGDSYDLIHAHDWLAFWASKVLKHSLLKPLVYTIHATEYGRNHGIYNEMQRYINDLEWYSAYEAWKVIVCSSYMREEIKHLFQVPEDKIITIPNGVNEANYRSEYSSSFRARFARPREKIIFYVGRIVREKGIHVLIEALPTILSKEPETRLVIAGKGPYLDELKELAYRIGVYDKVYFTGFISDDQRNRLYQVADVAVFPSLYEPFGIVALEAMITGTPLIVSRVGGLAEFVRNDYNGLTVEPGNRHHLAEAVIKLFKDREMAGRLAANAYRLARRDFSWEGIAEKTARIYQQILNEYKESDWIKDEIKRDINERDSMIYRYFSARRLG